MITILGNGLVGLITERICQLNHWDYQLLSMPQKMGKKTILLTKSSVDFLTKLGFNIPKQHKFSQLKITGEKQFHHLVISAEQYHQDVLCYSIPMDKLHKALSQYTQMQETLITGGEVSTQGIHLHTQDKTLITDYLFGCDGSLSISAKMGHFTHTTSSPYYIQVISASFDAPCLIQRYTKTAILAAIPGSPGTLIVSQKYPISQPSKERLQQAFAHNITLKAIYHHSNYTLTPSLRLTCFNHNILLLGNAALTIPPVAAQGLNHTIRNLKFLFETQDLNTQRLQTLSKTFQHNNQRIFQQMNSLTNTHLSCLRKTLFLTQYLSPLLEDFIFYFGNQYE